MSEITAVAGDYDGTMATVDELRDMLLKSQLECAYWRGRAEALSTARGKSGFNAGGLVEALGRLKPPSKGDGEA